MDHACLSNLWQCPVTDVRASNGDSPAKLHPHMELTPKVINLTKKLASEKQVAQMSAEALTIIADLKCTDC